MQSQNLITAKLCKTGRSQALYQVSGEKGSMPEGSPDALVPTGLIQSPIKPGLTASLRPIPASKQCTVHTRVAAKHCIKLLGSLLGGKALHGKGK